MPKAKPAKAQPSGERVRAAGVGLGGRPGGEPVMTRARRALSLSGMPRALRREFALLGAKSRSGTCLPVVDVASLENAGARRLDRVER